MNFGDCQRAIRTASRRFVQEEHMIRIIDKEHKCRDKAFSCNITKKYIFLNKKNNRANCKPTLGESTGGRRI